MNLKEMEKTKELEAYFYNFFSNRFADLDDLFRESHKNRMFLRQNLKNADEIFNLLANIHGNVEDKYMFKDLIPHKFATPEALFNSLDFFRNNLDQNQQYLDINKNGEDTFQIISDIQRFKNELIDAIIYSKKNYISSQTQIHINNMNPEEVPENTMTKISVFVTYSWDNEDHNQKVHAFTNFLRDEGFHAEIDKMQIQNETAKDFKTMMHKGMTDFKKVIVILSAGYKAKAQEFKGGVGNEYSLILKDIDENPNKYILVSFEGYSDSITPLLFKSREIIDLSTDNEEEKQKLFAKLLDKKLYEFNNVGSKLPEIKTKTAPPLFELQKDLIIDINLKFNQGDASYEMSLLTLLELEPYLTFKNNSKEIFNSYTIEVSYPKNTLSFEVNGRIEGEYKVVSIERNNNVFAQQTISIPLEKIIIRNYTIRQIIELELIVKIYTEKGFFEQKFPIKEFIIKDMRGQEQQISTAIFK